MAYIENPKSKGSGIDCAIPQKGRCPTGCDDCFFQSGRSFLEPLEKNLPNLPPNNPHRVIRVNDGNDSNIDRKLVISSTDHYPLRFFNTSIPVLAFPAPVVLTINPGNITDTEFHKVEPPKNLMFVRIRANTWNIDRVVEPAIEYYTTREIPVILTFMAYFNKKVPPEHADYYIFRTRTTNSYWAITTKAWEDIMARYKYNKWVYSCGKIEGERGITACRHCGNCLREYFATLCRMEG